MARRFARRAARIFSTGGGVVGISSSNSTGSDLDGVVSLRGLLSLILDGPGLWRGEILLYKREKLIHEIMKYFYWPYDTHSPSSFSSPSRPEGAA